MRGNILENVQETMETCSKTSFEGGPANNIIQDITMSGLTPISVNLVSGNANASLDRDDWRQWRYPEDRDTEPVEGQTRVHRFIMPNVCSITCLV